MTDRAQHDGPGVCLGVRLPGGELALFPDAIDELSAQAGWDAERTDAAIRELILEGSIRARICLCSDLPAHWHMVNESIIESWMKAQPGVSWAGPPRKPPR